MDVRHKNLSRLATDDGLLAILAIDHRDSLRVMLAPDDPASIAAADLTEFKRVVIEGAANEASGVMLEPEFSIPRLVPALPSGTGFIAALEAQGYEGDPLARVTQLYEGWSVAQAAEAGAAAVKLLIFYTPDAPGAAARQDALVRRIVAACRESGLPLFLEPLAYPTAPTCGERPGERRRLVVETARRLSRLGPDVLKLQFPAAARVDDPAGWDDACSELDEATAGPWALLSLGVPYDVFRAQLECACRAGASGFMVGRAAWGELIDVPPDQRPGMAAGMVAERIRELRAVACDLGRPLER